MITRRALLSTLLGAAVGPPAAAALLRVPPAEKVASVLPPPPLRLAQRVSRYPMQQIGVTLEGATVAPADRVLVERWLLEAIEHERRKFEQKAADTFTVFETLPAPCGVEEGWTQHIGKPVAYVPMRYVRQRQHDGRIIHRFDVCFRLEVWQ